MAKLGKKDAPKIEGDMPDEIEASRAPLMTHLLELRSRLIKCVGAVLGGVIICAPFLKQIIAFLMWPFEKALLRYNAN